MLELPKSANDLKHLKRLFELLQSKSPDAFVNLMRRCVDYRNRDNDEVLKDLVSIGMLEHDGLGEYRPRYAAYCLSDMWFVTDIPQRFERDSVFPLYPESEFFVGQMSIQSEAKALDVCTGCGIYAAFATRFTEHVTAIDINPRALEFARFNLMLNKIEAHVELLHGDLFQPVEGRKFDYISANPPFEPTPPGAFNYLHSDGGIDGLDTVRRLLKDVGSHLELSGRLEMVTFSLGGTNGLQVANECSPPTGSYAKIDIVYPPVSLESFSNRFDTTNIHTWLVELCNRGLSQMYLLLIKLDKLADRTNNEKWVVNCKEMLSHNVPDWTNYSI